MHLYPMIFSCGWTRVQMAGDTERRQTIEKMHLAPEEEIRGGGVCLQAPARLQHGTMHEPIRMLSHRINRDGDVMSKIFLNGDQTEHPNQWEETETRNKE